MVYYRSNDPSPFGIVVVIVVIVVKWLLDKVGGEVVKDAYRELRNRYFPSVKD